MEWSVNACEVGSSAAVQLQKDCVGNRRYTSGYATTSVTRTVVGIREKVLLGTFIDSIVPNKSDAVELWVSRADLENFTAYTVPAGQTTAAASLVIHEGRALGLVVPALGERKSDPGVFDIKTPVAKLSNVRLENAEVTLHSGAKQFKFAIDAAQLSAVAGSWGNASNVIGGQISVDGQIVNLQSLPLDPAFNQATFDATYSCTADLKALIR